MAPGRQIRFNYLEPVRIPQRTGLKGFLLSLFKKERHEVETVNFIFCSDAYLLSINQAHLQHDTYTDIITFPYHSPNEPIRSDIFISVERVKENSASFKTSFQEELLRVIFHGCLHLCGYGDKSKADQAAMRAREDYYLQKYRVSRGTKGPVKG